MYGNFYLTYVTIHNIIFTKSYGNEGDKMVIRGVLEEELKNSLQIKKRYEEELAKLPKGSFIKKKIKGHEYYYLILRENGKVKFIYKGKKISPEILKKYKEAKQMRAKYRELLSQVKKQIKFLKQSLKSGRQAS